jgi:hypothetical protein
VQFPFGNSFPLRRAAQNGFPLQGVENGNLDACESDDRTAACLDRRIDRRDAKVNITFLRVSTKPEIRR